MYVASNLDDDNVVGKTQPAESSHTSSKQVHV